MDNPSERRCPACGNHPIRPRYVDASKTGDPRCREWSILGENIRYCRLTFAHLHYTCMCGFKWSDRILKTESDSRKVPAGDPYMAERDELRRRVEHLEIENDNLQQQVLAALGISE